MPRESIFQTQHKCQSALSEDYIFLTVSTAVTIPFSKSTVTTVEEAGQGKAILSQAR